tara:strand:- start:608 stop:2788 length:2181 start_codon:yes stop_codon:yes gene_type:complete
LADLTIIKNEAYQPFNRYIDIGGLRIFGLDEVSDNFLNQVASTYEAMLASNDLINLEMRSAFSDILKENYIFQRVGFDSPEYYGGGDKLPQHPINGNYKDNQTDYIWEGLSRSEASQISTVIEHLLHTITGVGFVFQFSEWDPQDPSSKINLAMEQAIEGGYYDVSSYESIKLRGDDEGYAKAIVIEFSYWLILAEWEYFDITDKANNNTEFTLRTASDIANKLPLAHELYLDTAAKILSRPDERIIQSLFSKDSVDNDSNLEDAEETTTSLEKNIDDSIYSREGTFLGNNYTINMLGDNEDEIYAKGTGNAFVVGRDVFSEEQVKGILDNYEYVIKSISKTLSWKGTLDFVVVVQGDTGHPTGLLPSIAFQHGEDLTGEAGVLLGTNEDRVHVATYEQLSGIDLNGEEADLGFYINVTENNEFKNYDVDVWIDPNPSSTSYSNLPEGQHDLISIITHEITHAMGIAGTLDSYWSINHYSRSLTEKDGQYFYSSERITNLIGKDLLTEYQTGSSDDSLDHHVEDPEGGISGIASLMSGQMYSQRWSEPGPIEYAILYDSGWTERTTGKLSETIDLSKNILKSFSTETLSGTQNFNAGDNIIIADGQAKTLRGLDGDDTYFISNLLPKNSSITIIDTSGINIIQIPSNTQVTKSQWAKDTVRLTFDDSRIITVNNADNFTYNIGGNVTNGLAGTDLTFSELGFLFGINDISNMSGSSLGSEVDMYII